jgi:uncharacterized GH25 family protein
MSHISTPWARARALAALVAVAVGVAPLSAHDLWIEASAFRPDPGRVVGLHLRVGQDFLGDPIPRDPTLIEQFVAITPDRTTPIVGQDGADPAGLLRQVTPALVVVAYRSRSTAITLPPEKFNQYLRDEGLDDVARMRVERKQDHDPARELFARCAKALIQTGAPSSSETDRAVGMTLELIAARNPYTLRAGDSLSVQLLHEQKPLKGALVTALNRQHPGTRVAIRTDASGRAIVPLSEAGDWLIKAVHMVEAAQGSGAEWQSYWASLTFELGEPRGMTGPALR